MNLYASDTAHFFHNLDLILKVWEREHENSVHANPSFHIIPSLCMFTEKWNQVNQSKTISVPYSKGISAWLVVISDWKKMTYPGKKTLLYILNFWTLP